MFRLFGLALSQLEDQMVHLLVRSPRFNHAVQRLHKIQHEIRHGRNPEELRPGEATSDPNKHDSAFFRHFVDELKLQAQGKETKLPDDKK